MKEFLKKLRLVDFLTVELEIPKNEFVNRLRANVDPGDTSVFSESFDVFSSSKNEYKGHVSDSEFKIKHRRRFFDMNFNMAIAKGKYEQGEGSLKIEAEINGFTGMMIPFYILGIIIYLVLLISVLNGDEVTGFKKTFSIPFILFHALFMFGLPYFMMRRGVKRLKHDLEREFYYLSK